MINQQTLQEFPTISKNAAEGLKSHSEGQAQGWTVNACSSLFWKVPEAVWVPKCCKFIANILVSILSTYIAVRFRKSSRNLDHWGPIMCAVEIFKATFLPPAAQLISYLPLILRSDCSKVFYLSLKRMWQWTNTLSGIPTYFILRSPAKRQHVCFMMLFTTFLPYIFGYLLLLQSLAIGNGCGTTQTRKFPSVFKTSGFFSF